MKTGRPEYHIPSPETVSHDVKDVFVQVRKRIAKMLQVRDLNIVIYETCLKPSKEHEGDLNFTTDAWTLPNNKAYVAVSVHFEVNGVAVGMLLDVVEVPHSHTGLNLAAAFAKILDDFGISDNTTGKSIVQSE